MNTSESFQALRRANPRAKAGFAQPVEAAADALHAQIVTTAADVAMDAGAPVARTRRSSPRRRLLRVSAVGVSLAAAAAMAAVLTLGSPGRRSRRRERSDRGQERRGRHGGLGRAFRYRRRPDHPQRRGLGRKHDPLERP
jgi:hypothetical protein